MLRKSYKLFKFVDGGHPLQRTNEKYFNKILIANRGEIACRVIYTAKKLGIKTVAVFSDADANSKFVRMADEAYYIGKPPVSESYLRQDKIIKACMETGAEAVHPGYGFMSENAGFVKKLEERGIVFIGPSSYSIHSMGDKIESKRIAKNAKVSIIPGYDGELKDVKEAMELANNSIGYPVMVKASGGGGGKGMRICYNDAELIEGFRLAQQEAKSNFGSESMLIEKYIEQPRHIEIQVLGDKHGNYVYVGERECSIQRRNQKVIEESPSMKLTPKVRQMMGEQACMLARAVKYHTAGTVEMLVDVHSNFYFLEMNTRLQVEHPITEYVYGVDLVEQMIRVAAGKPLSIKQSDIKINGWATECRVYAEDPLHNYAPSVGNLVRYQEPTDLNGHVRVDSGIQERAEISVFYDPMICKLITYGKTRQDSINKMKEALDTYVIHGVTHNINLLREVMDNKVYMSGNITTAFLKQQYPDGFKGTTMSKKEVDYLFAFSSVVELMNKQRAFTSGANCVYKDEYIVTRVDKDPADKEGKKERETKKKVVINTVQLYKEYTVSIEGGKPITVKPQNYQFGNPIFRASFDNDNLILQIAKRQPEAMTLQYKGTRFNMFVRTPETEKLQKIMPFHPPPDLSKFLVAPMPGAIVSVAVKVGDKVKTNQELCVMEAMKMQNVLRSHGDLLVKKVNIKPKDVVSDAQILIEFDKL